MKRIIAFAVLLLASFAVFSQTMDKPDYIHGYERVLDQAEVAYDDGDFGEALNLAEKSKNLRRFQIKYEIFTLENSFKSSEVKQKGDSLTNIIKILNQREDYDAVEVIARNQRKYGEERFNDSKTQLLNFIKTNDSFPEADYLIGQIYCLEGEYEIAYKYLFQAYENSENLDVKDVKYDILYKLADVSLLLHKDDKYEEFLLLILSQSPEFKDASLAKVMKKTVESTRADCLEKFFSLYRCNNYSLLKAYFALTQYYQSHNKKEKALHVCQLGVITAYTKIIDVIKKRNAEFEVTGLQDVLEEASKYPDIIQWGIENDIWKGFYTLAELSHSQTNLIFAVNLLHVLKDYEPEDYWKDKAFVKLNEITVR